jgi:hypothetical protein
MLLNGEGEVKKRMKVALTRKMIVLTLAALMLTVGVVFAAASVSIWTKPSNTITAQQTVTIPKGLVVWWVEPPPASGVVTNEQFMMIVGVNNTNLGALGALTFNVTVTGTGIYPAAGPAVSVSMSTGDLSTSYYNGYETMSVWSSTGTNNIVFLGSSITVPPGETMWGFLATSYVSSTLKWSVTVVAPPSYYVS